MPALTLAPEEQPVAPAVKPKPMSSMLALAPMNSMGVGTMTPTVPKPMPDTTGTQRYTGPMMNSGGPTPMGDAGAMIADQQQNTTGAEPPMTSVGAAGLNETKGTQLPTDFGRGALTPLNDTKGKQLPTDFGRGALPSGGSPNRLQLATDALATTAAATEPYYQKALRDAGRSAAAVGGIGSGQLRTSLGDAAHLRGLELDKLRSDAITRATEGMIGDEQFAARLALDKDLGYGSLSIQQKALALQEKLGLAGLSADERRMALAEKEQAANEAYRTGQLTLAERDAALRELAQAQQYEIALAGDRTQNRGLDLTSQQGQRALLLELARIMGGPSGNIDPAFLAAIARSLGITLPGASNTTGAGAGAPDGAGAGVGSTGGPTDTSILP